MAEGGSSKRCTWSMRRLASPYTGASGLASSSSALPVPGAGSMAALPAPAPGLRVSIDSVSSGMRNTALPAASVTARAMPPADTVQPAPTAAGACPFSGNRRTVTRSMVLLAASMVRPDKARR
jgi:hypothetical protein